MIEFQVEWMDAPGVGDSVLASTWARLGLRVNGREVFEFIGRKSRGLRNGIYGSVFPLASWFVENWWNILYEPPILPEIFDGARSLRPDERRQRRFVNWMRRHNLLFAREGMALPDMSLFRDEDRIFVRWLPDPNAEEKARSFIGEGSERLKPEDVEAGLRDFVSCVLERLEGEPETHELAELRANWLAIFDSQKNEPELCEALAALGEDPYDVEDIDEGLLSVLQERVLTLKPTLRHDLLGATSLSTLDVDCRCVENLNDRLEQLTGEITAPWRMPDGLPTGKTVWPHEDGYQRAKELRKILGIDRHEPIRDLTQLITTNFGEFTEEHVGCPTKRINGLVARNKTGRCVLITPEVKPLSSSRRFLEARALHQWLFTIGDRAPERLLTGSHEWDQRASRAFAAELLAPAAAIQRNLDDENVVDDEDYVRTLANHFDVSTRVIEHQIHNHRLAA